MSQFDEEEAEVIHYYDPLKGYIGGNPMDEMSWLTMISYEYVDLDKTPFNFHQAEFDGDDRKIYFSKLKSYAKKTVSELLNDLPREEHFKLKWSESPSKREIGLLEKVFGTELRPETIPYVGHFALYTDPNFNAKSYEAGVKVRSPRIFFFLDRCAVLQILFYDPFHDINPPGKSTLESLKNQEK